MSLYLPPLPLSPQLYNGREGLDPLPTLFLFLLLFPGRRSRPLWRQRGSKAAHCGHEPGQEWWRLCRRSYWNLFLGKKRRKLAWIFPILHTFCGIQKSDRFILEERVGCFSHLSSSSASSISSSSFVRLTTLFPPQFILLVLVLFFTLTLDSVEDYFEIIQNQRGCVRSGGLSGWFLDRFLDRSRAAWSCCRLDVLVMLGRCWCWGQGQEVYSTCCCSAGFWLLRSQLTVSVVSSLGVCLCAHACVCGCRRQNWHIVARPCVALSPRRALGFTVWFLVRLGVYDFQCVSVGFSDFSCSDQIWLDRIWLAGLYLVCMFQEASPGLLWSACFCSRSEFYCSLSHKNGWPVSCYTLWKNSERRNKRKWLFRLFRNVFIGFLLDSEFYHVDKYRNVFEKVSSVNVAAVIFTSFFKGHLQQVSVYLVIFLIQFWCL